MKQQYGRVLFTLSILATFDAISGSKKSKRPLPAQSLTSTQETRSQLLLSQDYESNFPPLSHTTTEKVRVFTDHEVIETNWPKCKGWEKPKDFVQYVEHNTDTTEGVRGELDLKNSLIITSANTDTEKKEIKKPSSDIQSTYIAQKWLYPKKKDLSITETMLTYCDQDLQLTAHKSPTKKEIETIANEKTPYLAELKTKIKERLVQTTQQHIINGFEETLTDEQLAKITDEQLAKIADETLKTHSVPQEWVHESPAPFNYPKLILKTELSSEEQHQNVIIIDDSKEENKPREVQYDYLKDIMMILNGENFVLVGNKLFDLEKTDVRKMTPEEIDQHPGCPMPRLASSDSAPIVFYALERLRDGTRPTKQKFDQYIKTKDSDIKQAFENFYGTCAKTKLLEEHKRARRLLALKLSENLPAKGSNYIAKRELFINAAHNTMKTRYVQQPTTTNGWFGWFSSSTPASTQSSSLALPTSSPKQDNQ